MLLDLRRNRAEIWEPWLLGGEPTHVCDVIYRDRTPMVEDRAARGSGAAPETPLSVLVGERTFSSGEGLAYDLQSQCRGQARRAANAGRCRHITPVRVSRHVRALLPEACVRDAITRTNWEGTGVRA